jgi:signal transduction histidine kinase
MLDKYFQRIVNISLGASPEKMLETSLGICVEIAGGASGSILGEEGPSLRFLFSAVPELIGVSVPFNSIAGETVLKNKVVYTFAPADKRHFTGVDQKIRRTTNFLLSVPIPSIHQSERQDGKNKNAGALQILFNEDIFPDLGVADGQPAEFALDDFKHSPLAQGRLANIFLLLPMIAFGIEVMRLRQTSYQVIHELKNKMISSQSWIAYLRDDLAAASPETAAQAEIVEDLDLAETASREGAALARDFLQFTKLYTPDFAPCQVNNILAETAAAVKAIANDLGAKDFTVTTSLDPEMPEAELDAGKLKMAFFNLCKNGVEALVSRATPGPAISISSRHHPGGIGLSFADNGPGMPQEIADNLFIPFKTKKEGGTGLGLTITKKIIDLHGGAIACLTGPDGTSFTINLPK